ncbi:MAG: hypothetical protein H0U63_06725, partial [Burkholderiales bacterium]|nr:hypothetical protein [Burkholderiales bacterium]
MVNAWSKLSEGYAPHAAGKYRRYEVPLLIALILVLPNFEVPKHLLSLAYAVVWIVNRAPTRNFGGRWDIWDTTIVIWIASGYVVAAFAGLHQTEWRGALDIPRYVLIAWAIKRSGYDETQLKRLLLAVVISAVIALAYGFWRLYVTGLGGALQLRSVGHVNHSAVFLATSYSVSLAVLLAYWRTFSGSRRMLMALAALALSAGVFFTGSRGAVGAVVVTSLLLAVGWWKYSTRPIA